jgi:hypothetical protein
MKTSSLLVVVLLFAAISPALADGPNESNPPAALLSTGDDLGSVVPPPRTERELGLLKTIEKRKAKKARDRRAYLRSSAEASATQAAMIRQGNWMYGARTQGPGAMYFQSYGQPGADYSAATTTGGAPRCMRP